MADIAENTPIKDAAIAISQGKRHLLVRDYSMAVTVLTRACELLVQEHGDTADELGELYILYGRALLGLAREEAGVLGGGVPGSEDQDDQDDQDEEDENRENEFDNKDEADKDEEADTNDENKEESENITEDTNNISTEGLQASQTESNKEQDSKEKAEETKPMNEKSKVGELNKTDDSKIEEKKMQQEQQEVANCSHNISPIGEASNSKQMEQDDSEDIEKEADEEEVNNLQIAWEVLELAKLVILKRGPSDWKHLAECYRLLGEVAMEGGNHEGALTDLEGCMNLLQKITPRDDRAIAEIHYQLGLAHSLANDFDASIQQFNMATSLLEARINELQKIKEPPESDDPFYTVEGEIQELKELLPEIHDKIIDIKDFKREACRIKEIKDKIIGSCSNGAGPSDASDNVTIPKPASDISHLIRKKRKAEEEDQDANHPYKKPTPEKDT